MVCVENVPFKFTLTVYIWNICIDIFIILFSEIREGLLKQKQAQIKIHQKHLLVE